MDATGSDPRTKSHPEHFNQPRHPGDGRRRCRTGCRSISFSDQKFSRAGTTRVELRENRASAYGVRQLPPSGDFASAWQVPVAAVEHFAGQVGMLQSASNHRFSIANGLPGPATLVLATLGGAAAAMWLVRKVAQRQRRMLGPLLAALSLALLSALLHAGVVLRYGVISDRYAYAMLVALVLLAAAVLESWLPHTAAENAPALLTALRKWGLVALSVALMPLTWARDVSWHDEHSLQLAMIADRPNDPESELATPKTYKCCATACHSSKPFASSEPRVAHPRPCSASGLRAADPSQSCARLRLRAAGRGSHRAKPFSLASSSRASWAGCAGDRGPAAPGTRRRRITSQGLDHRRRRITGAARPPSRARRRRRVHDHAHRNPAPLRQLLQSSCEAAAPPDLSASVRGSSSPRAATAA